MNLKTKLFLMIFPLMAALAAWPFVMREKSPEKNDLPFVAAAAGLSELGARQEQSVRATAGFLSQEPLWGDIKSADQGAALNAALTSLQRKGAFDLLFYAGSDGEVKDAAWAGEGWTLDEVRQAVRPIFSRPRKSGFFSLGGRVYLAATTPVAVNSASGYLGVATLFPFAGFLRTASGMESASTDRSGRWTGSSFALTPDESLRLTNLGEGVEAVSLAGSRYFARTMKLEGESGPRIALLASVTQAVPHDENRLLPLFSLVVAALASVGIAWYLSLTVSRPLQLLASAVKDMGAGGPPAPSSVADRRDEVGAVATSFNLLAVNLGNELKQKEKALAKLEKYQSQLLDLNHRLAKKLYENRVMLSLWKEQEKSEDTKDFLSHILEEILQGLPFHYGCIIIRPLAQIGPEVILARVERSQGGKGEVSVTDILERSDRTHWLSSLSPELKEFLLRMNQESAEGQRLRLLQDMITVPIEPEGKPQPLHVISVRLAQGNQHMGSLHFITEKERFPFTASDEEFLTSVASQVSVALDNRSLQHANRVDPLTRLYNRGYMNDRIREEMMRTGRTHHPFTLLLLDIDHFKNVNDTHGHQAGDDVLVGLAALLKRSCRASDAICRYGGEELAIILVDTALPGAKMFAENIRKTIEAEIFPIPEGKSVRITASIGLAEFPGQAGSMQELVKHADDALYTAKREGRNSWRAFQSA